MEIGSILNFRPLGGKIIKGNGNNEQLRLNIGNLKVFRSARLDNITHRDILHLDNDLGIRQVFDLRKFDREYLKQDGEKLLDTGAEREDGLSSLQVVDTERTTDKKIYWKDISEHKHLFAGQEPFHTLRHTFVDLLSLRMILAMLKNCCGFLQLIWGFLLLVCDLVIQTENFAHFFMKNIAFEIDILQLYKLMIDYNEDAILTLLRLMNDPANLPCLICCQHGKDRTGIICAFLLALLGCSDEMIANEYALSSIEFPATHPSLSKYSESLRSCKRETMLDLLKYINKKYGSVSCYLVSIGFSKQEQSELIDNIKDD